MDELIKEDTPSDGAVLEARSEARSRAYVICTAPRTGSSLLGDALSRTGVAGRPAEYFDIYAHNQQYWARTLGIERAEHYFDRVVQAGTTPNGVFGVKIHWHQLPALFAAYKAAPLADPARSQPRTIDDCLLPRLASSQYLWLRRRNKVAQGVSYYRAARSEIWRVAAGLAEDQIPKSPLIAFDYEKIDQHVQMCERFDQLWYAYIMRHKLRAMVLIYEDFTADYTGTVRGVCDFLGVGGSDLAVPAPGLRRQADQVSVGWELEYRRLKGLPADPTGSQVTVLASRPRRGPARSASSEAEPGPPPADAAEPDASVVSAPAVAAPESPEATTIIAYDLGADLGVKIAPASPRRAWMDASPGRFVYRCLPLVIANQHGWLLLSPCRIEAMWNGGTALDALTITAATPQGARIAASHFGSGILTFSVGLLFRTPPGINLHVRGPANMPKDGICPLEGVVETDWSEATFTMNWQMTRPGHPVVFEAGEPIAMVSPLRRGDIERFEPQVRSLASDPALRDGYAAWSASRSLFNRDLKIKDSWAQKAGWQRHYVRGETVSNRKAREHQTSLNVRPFTDTRDKPRGE